MTAGVLKTSFCIVCTLSGAEYSLCLPQDNEEIARGISFNILVFPNSTCTLSPTADDKVCNSSFDIINTDGSFYCGLKLNISEKETYFNNNFVLAEDQLIKCNNGLISLTYLHSKK